MKKLLLIVLAALVLLTGCTAKQKAKDIPYDVQAFDWTIPYEYFEGQEEYELATVGIPGEDFFKYSETTVFGYNADVVYHYNSNTKELYRIEYVFKFSDIEDDINIVYQILTNQFGNQLNDSKWLPEWRDSENKLEITLDKAPTNSGLVLLHFSQITEES